jgi:hypothetical protein
MSDTRGIECRIRDNGQRRPDDTRNGDFVRRLLNRSEW